MSLLSVRGLRKSYGALKVTDDLGLEAAGGLRDYGFDTHVVHSRLADVLPAG